MVSTGTFFCVRAERESRQSGGGGKWARLPLAVHERATIVHNIHQSLALAFALLL